MRNRSAVHAITCTRTGHVMGDEMPLDFERVTPVAVGKGCRKARMRTEAGELWRLWQQFW